MNTRGVPEVDADPHATTPWQRLHPLSPMVRAGRHLVSIGAIILVGLVGSQHAHNDRRWELIVIGIAIVAGVVTWLVTRWRLVDGVLHIESGLLKRSSSRYPLSRVQAIDIAQSGIARVLGLAELRLRMASGGGNTGRLACLTVAHATRLRNELLAIARAEREELAQAGHAPGSTQAVMPGADTIERLGSGEPLAVTDPLRLVLGTLTAGVGLAAVVVSVAFAAGLLMFPDAARVIAAGGIWPIIGLAGALWKRFNGDYRLTTHATDTGFQLRSGLVQTASETISRDRIQLVRLHQPLLWRLFGWCRVEVEVAGTKVKKENRAEGQVSRPLLAVGRLETGKAIIANVAPEAPECSLRPPRRAFWKAPLSMHLLAIGIDERYVAARRGRLAATTTWIPLAKVQSIRAAEGPVQRRLGLATVHLDVAGAHACATLQDRDIGEALELLARLPARCAAQRGRGQLNLMQESIGGS
ncbi:MAG TPA: PH domain-containing protein [Rhodanobacteraceae bacterium]|nr:PH domain-containing protein [Rhodanobacteraceae bacterium]